MDGLEIDVYIEATGFQQKCKENSKKSGKISKQMLLCWLITTERSYAKRRKEKEKEFWYILYGLYKI